jgi:hypothetical protein
MRRFFLTQGVRIQVVARPLPHIIELPQHPAERVVGHPLLRDDLQNFRQQWHGPVAMGITQALGRPAQESLQQVLLVLIQQRPTSPALFVL